MKTDQRSETMTTHHAELKAFEDKIEAQLREAKAKLDQLEAQRKEQRADAEIKAINAFRTQQHELEKKRQELKTVGEAKMGQLKAEIEAGLAKLKTLENEVSAKIKTHHAITA
jgi:uncharacterized protein involved in exopolysaccharide biosynthesis